MNCNTTHYRANSSSVPGDPTDNPDWIRDISVAIYKMRLDDPSGGGHGAVERMLAKDGDAGQKLRGRAASYDPLTRAYVRYFRDYPLPGG